MKNKKILLTAGSVSVILGIWMIVAAVIDSPVIFPYPHSVVADFLRLFTDKSFYLNVGATVLRSLESFVIIVFAGAVAGIAAGKNRYVETLIKPLVAVFKATPVMSVVLVAFIWFRTGAVPVFSAFLMAFPVMFVQTLNGMQNIDKKLIQMCNIYRINGIKRLKEFTLPALMPSIITGARQSLSMIWKVVIAAEVLTIPEKGIGKSLQLSQIQLETSKVFAWTVVAILLTSLGDYILNSVLESVVGRRMMNENH